MTAHYDRSALDALPGAHAPFPWRRAAVLGVGALCLLLLGIAVARGTLSPPGRGPELVSPLDPDVQAAAVFAGTFLGLLACALVWHLWRGERQGDQGGDDRPGLLDLAYETVLAIAFSLAAAFWCARSLLCTAAFAGLQPVPVPVVFTVVGTGGDSDDDGDGATWLRVQAGPADRTFSYRVDPIVRAAAHAGDTVTLPVEIGRWHVRRTRAGPVLTIADLHRR